MNVTACKTKTLHFKQSRPLKYRQNKAFYFWQIITLRTEITLLSKSKHAN